MIIANTKEDKNTVNKTGLQNFVSHLLLGNEHMFLAYFGLNSSTTFIFTNVQNQKVLAFEKWLRNQSVSYQEAIRNKVIAE